jgi:hypothetical protein
MRAANVSSFEDGSSASFAPPRKDHDHAHRSSPDRSGGPGLLIATGSVAPSHAANCERSLRTHYQCTATYGDGGSSEYCLRAEASIGGGLFALAEPSGDFFSCTCAPRGKAPNVEFGGAARDFACGRDEVVLAGKLTGSKLTGHGFAPNGLRSAFTCRAVETCP